MAISFKITGIIVLLLFAASALRAAGSNGMAASPPAEDLTLTVTLKDGGASLIWQMNTAIFSYITGFDVERRSGTDGMWDNLGFVTEGVCTDAACSWQYADRMLPDDGEDVYYRVKVYQIGEQPWYSRDVLLETSSLPPKSVSLFQSYPNPVAANATATIRYRQPASGLVTLAVYNATGRRIATLTDGTVPPGTYDVPFNTAGIPAGVYYYRLETPEASIVRKVVVGK